MAAPSRSQVLSLYRSLLRESRSFPSYNYRTYALRRVRDAFRENRSVEDPKALDQLLNKARDSLAIVQRQRKSASSLMLLLQKHTDEHLVGAHLSTGMKVAIGRLYEAQRIVVEPEPKKCV